jgi:hypothetical protein
MIIRKMMQILATGFPEVRIVVPRRFDDARGFFPEVWNARALAGVGIEAEFVQDNHALNRRRGTLRGLHYQIAPCAQGKLVRVARGAVFDVAVDVRRGSPRFGRHVADIFYGHSLVDSADLAVSGEVDGAVAGRVAHPVAEDAGSGGARRRSPQGLGSAITSSRGLPPSSPVIPMADTSRVCSKSADRRGPSRASTGCRRR